MMLKARSIRLAPRWKAPPAAMAGPIGASNATVRPCPLICCANRSAPKWPSVRTEASVNQNTAGACGLTSQAPHLCPALLAGLFCGWCCQKEWLRHTVLLGEGPAPRAPRDIFEQKKGADRLAWHWVARFVVGRPVGDFGVIHVAPVFDAGVHHLAPDWWDHRRHGHDRVAIGQLRGFVRVVVLQQRKAAVGFVVVVGMALQVDQQPVRRLMRR